MKGELEALYAYHQTHNREAGKTSIDTCTDHLCQDMKARWAEKTKRGVLTK